MGESSEQSFAVDDKWTRFDWKRRAASRVFGERNARRLARPPALAKARLENSITPSGRANSAYIRQFRNRHEGERCVIIGNGPSLRKTNLSLLRDEYTFGLNRIYLMFDELGFDTTFHVVINQFVVEQWANDLQKIKSPLFTVTKNRSHLDGSPDTGYLNSIIGPWFSRDAGIGIWEGHTVTYVAMQLAYYMGFSEVVLIGVDHKFAVSGTPNQLVDSTGADASHFDPNYFAKGFKWQLPDLDNSEVAYRLARNAFEDDNRRIVDATVGGALTVFPKATLEKALGR